LVAFVLGLSSDQSFSAARPNLTLGLSNARLSCVRPLQRKVQRSATLASACSRNLPVCWSVRPMVLGFHSSRPLWRRNIFGAQLLRLMVIQVLGFFGARRVPRYITLVLSARRLHSSTAPVLGLSTLSATRRSSALGPFAHRSGPRPLQSTAASILGRSSSRFLQFSTTPVHGCFGSQPLRPVLGHFAALAPRCLALGAPGQYLRSTTPALKLCGIRPLRHSGAQALLDSNA
jgi:hypothetical protein